MLEQDLILQIMSQKGHYVEEEIKTVIGLMKDELGEKFMAEFAALRPKTYSYQTDDNDENKKQKAQKSAS